MPSINLAPGTQYIVQARKHRRRLFVFSFLIIIVTAATWFGLNVYEGQLQQELATVDEQVRNIELEIAKIEPDANRIILFEDRLEALDGLLNQHISWNIILQDVERLLPPNTALKSFTALADSGRLDITGTTENIDQVAVTLATLLNSTTHETVFINGKLGSIRRTTTSGNEEGDPEKVEYTFGAELNFDPSIIRNGS